MLGDQSHGIFAQMVKESFRKMSKQSEQEINDEIAAITAKVKSDGGIGNCDICSNRIGAGEPFTFEESEFVHSYCLFMKEKNRDHVCSDKCGVPDDHECTDSECECYGS